jgi:serine/threonine protein kinase
VIGTTISHYRITEKLGEGGMGVVYKAEDTKLDRPVALKFLAPHLLRDEEGRKRFEREAKAAAKLDHPNICTVYEIDEAEGRTFIVMAFLEGRPLSERIQEGPLKLAEALSIAIQMAEGLEAAHEKGITHRDIKPDNVMLMSGSRGLVKLMDFGLAQLAGSSKFTREGTTLGTVNYMSPEQAEGSPTGRSTDIWSLGVVLYEMVAGQRPFRGEVDQAVIYSIVNEQPEPLTALRTGVPKDLDRVVDKCLAKDADERYQHIADLLVDLQALKRELGPGQPKLVTKPSAKHTSPALIVGMAAVLLAVGLAWWLSRSSESGIEPPPQYKLTQITRDSGYTGQPALSPDGKLLAYVSDRAGGGTLDLWVQQIAGGKPIQLTRTEAGVSNPSFSPDGSQIVYGGFYGEGGSMWSPRLVETRDDSRSEVWARSSLRMVNPLSTPWAIKMPREPSTSCPAAAGSPAAWSWIFLGPCGPTGLLMGNFCCF